jgi:hypothetical protein
MASERQIAANRRNADKSTGPRSEPGKKRASQNAYRHGLTVRPSSVEFERQVEVLARQIAGDAEDKMTLEDARVAAEAELELARVRQVKTALIERIVAFGGFECPKHFRSDEAEVRWVIARLEHYEGLRARPIGPRRPKAVDPLATMPAEEPQRSAEAARRILRDLVHLHRYECRAVTRRDRAIRAMMLRSKGSELQF